MSTPRILIYLLRRDLRLADNPAFHEISKSLQEGSASFTHLLPVYVFPAQQLEVSGFLSSRDARSPFPQARSRVGGFWRCGPHRARFLAESVWDVKASLEKVGSGLVIRVGMVGQVLDHLLKGFKEHGGQVVGVWMTSEEGVEEKREERDVRRATQAENIEFQLLRDEKYLVDDRDLPFKTANELPDVFTTFRKTVEPLRDVPRSSLPTCSKLPPLPKSIPPQEAPFTIPSSVDAITSALLKPLNSCFGVKNAPSWPKSAQSAHPFQGGETHGHDRIKHLITRGRMSTYKDTRNGLLGVDFSTKLSAWLALGCITARQVHLYLLDFEDGTAELGKGAQGYGKGENHGTAAVRFELLWRDYMRLCTRKFGPRLFRVTGFRQDKSIQWKYTDHDPAVKAQVTRFLEGTTGTGLIDASMRELFLTGYTSNRARQNVASFFAKHLGIDWRIGAEWYEMLLADYDVSSNWGNWQYTAGVGNDPRGEARIFNPVKQAFDYDPKGEYVKAWVTELRGINDPQVIFQAWKLPEAERKMRGLQNSEWVEKPLKRIDFQIGRSGGKKTGGWKNSNSSTGQVNGENGCPNGTGGEYGRGRGGRRFGVRGGGPRGRGKGEKGRGYFRNGVRDRVQVS